MTDPHQPRPDLPAEMREVMARYGTYVSTLADGTLGLACGSCNWEHTLPTPFLLGDAGRLANEHYWARQHNHDQAIVDEWTRDPVNRALDALWNAALDSQAHTFVDGDGNVGRLAEEQLGRRKTRAMRQARAEVLLWLGQRPNATSGG